MTRVRIVGDPDLSTAYSGVNRAWLAGLRAAGYDTTEEGPTDALIHHDYSQHFATCSFDDARLRIAARPWDFGPFPQAWTARVGTELDRLWVFCRWARDKAIEGGAPADRVDVAPLGVDPSVFHPEGPPAARDDRFHFLFVGATVPRKGIDVLLQAYARAFAPDEPVRLTLKGNAGDVFYRGVRMEAAIREFAADPDRPALRHVDTYLEPETLAALYRSADAGVFPYRAEGFALPIVEAMACGLPCIVPKFGPSLDYCTDATTCFVAARRVRLPVRRELDFNTLGFREEVDRVDFCQVPVDELAASMRALYESSETERRRRGRAAAERVANGWTWSHSVDAVVRLLREAGCAP